MSSSAACFSSVRVAAKTPARCRSRSSAVVKSCATPPVSSRSPAGAGLAQSAFGGSRVRPLVQPARAMAAPAREWQQKKGHRQAEDQVARHGREPFAPTIADSSMPPRRRPGSPAACDSPRAGRSGDLGFRDRIDRGLLPCAIALRSGRDESSRARVGRTYGGEESAVGGTKPWRLPELASDQAVRILEVARNHRDRRDAVEGVVPPRRGGGEDEERFATARSGRRGHSLTKVRRRRPHGR